MAPFKPPSHFPSHVALASSSSSHRLYLSHQPNLSQLTAFHSANTNIMHWLHVLTTCPTKHYCITQRPSSLQPEPRWESPLENFDEGPRHKGDVELGGVVQQK